MSHLPQSARTLGSTLLSALPPSVRRVLAALPLGDNKVPTPEAAFHCESVLLTVVGVLHVLAPVFVLRTSFFSGLQRESACADESGAEAIGAALVALIQAVGGLYLLTASALCTAAEVATKQMLMSLSAGHLLNAAIHLSVILNFSLPGGSFGLTATSLALHTVLSASLCCIARNQQPPTPPPARQPLTATDIRANKPSSQQQQQQQETAAKRLAEKQPTTADKAAQPSAASSSAGSGKEEAEEIDDSDEDEGEMVKDVERMPRAHAMSAFGTTLSKRLSGSVQ